MIARLSAHLGTATQDEADRVRRVFERMGLPIRTEIDFKRLVKALKHDKKKEADSVRLRFTARHRRLRNPPVHVRRDRPAAGSGGRIISTKVPKQKASGTYLCRRLFVLNTPVRDSPLFRSLLVKVECDERIDDVRDPDGDSGRQQSALSKLFAELAEQDERERQHDADADVKPGSSAHFARRQRLRR